MLIFSYSLSYILQNSSIYLEKCTKGDEIGKLGTGIFFPVVAKIARPLWQPLGTKKRVSPFSMHKHDAF